MRNRGRPFEAKRPRHYLVLHGGPFVLLGACLGGRGLLAVGRGDPAGEFGARTNPELVEDSRQVRLDGLHGDEQDVGDLAVLLPFPHQLGDPLLGGCELVGRQHGTADTGEVVSRPLPPQRRTEGLKETKRLLQGGAGGSLLLGSAFHLALYQQGPGQLEGLRHPPVLHQSLLQRRTGPRQIAPGSGEQPSTSRGGGDGPWPIEGSSLPLQMTEECLGLIQPSQ